MYRYMQLDMRVLGYQPNLIEFSPSLASNTNNFRKRVLDLFFPLKKKKKKKKFSPVVVKATLFEADYVYANAPLGSAPE